MEYDFSCHPIYIRTYRNHLADWISRESPEVVHSELCAAGRERDALESDWAEVMEILRTGALRLPGESSALASLATALAQSEGLSSPPPSIALTSQWSVFVQGDVRLSSAGIALARHGLSPSQEGTHWWLTLSQDPSGSEWAAGQQVLASQEHLSFVCIDVPRHCDPLPLTEELEEMGLCPCVESYRTSDIIGAPRHLVLGLDKMRVGPPPRWPCSPYRPATPGVRGGERRSLHPRAPVGDHW